MYNLYVKSHDVLSLSLVVRGHPKKAKGRGASLTNDRHVDLQSGIMCSVRVKKSVIEMLRNLILKNGAAGEFDRRSLKREEAPSSLEKQGPFQ
jgi:hypothetical protein